MILYTTLLCKRSSSINKLLFLSLCDELVERLDCKYLVFRVLESDIIYKYICKQSHGLDLRLMEKFRFRVTIIILNLFSSTLFAYTFKSINSMFIIWWQLTWNRSICIHMVILLLFWVRHANYVLIWTFYFISIWDTTLLDPYLSIIGKNDVVESNVRTVVFPRTTIFSRVTRRIVSSLPIALLLMLFRDFEPNIFISIAYHKGNSYYFLYVFSLFPIFSDKSLCLRWNTCLITYFQLISVPLQTIIVKFFASVNEIKRQICI